VVRGTPGLFVGIVAVLIAEQCIPFGAVRFDHSLRRSVADAEPSANSRTLGIRPSSRA
jgi:hypothetical protein